MNKHQFQIDDAIILTLDIERNILNTLMKQNKGINLSNEDKNK